MYHCVVNGRFVVRFVVYEGQYPKYENDLKSKILKGELLKPNDVVGRNKPNHVKNIGD